MVMSDPRPVSERSLLAIAVLILTITIQIAALNSSWFFIEVHSEEQDPDPEVYDRTTISIHDSLHDRVTVSEQEEMYWSSYNDEYRYDSDAISHVRDNDEMMGDYDNMVMSKRTTLVMVYGSLICTIITFAFVLLRAVAPFDNANSIRAPAAIGVVISCLILALFPFIFTPLNDATHAGHSESSEMDCNSERTSGIPIIWVTYDADNCVSGGKHVDLTGVARVSTGYFLQFGVMALQFIGLAVVRKAGGRGGKLNSPNLIVTTTRTSQVDPISIPDAPY